MRPYRLFDTIWISHGTKGILGANSKKWDGWASNEGNFSKVSKRSWYPLNPLFLKFLFDSLFIVKKSPSLDHYLSLNKVPLLSISKLTYSSSNLIFLAHQILMQTIYKALAIGLSLGVRKKPMWLMRLLEWECWIVFRRTLFSKLALKCWNSLISLHIGLKRKTLWP